MILIAGLLFTVRCSLHAQTIKAEDAAKHVGETVMLCGKVFGGRYFEKNEKTLLNMGGAFPNHTLTLVIDSADRKKFTGKPEDTYLNKEVCVKGEIRDFKGKPELQITEVVQIFVKGGEL